MRFTVEGTPIPKGRPRFARKGTSVHIYTPKRTKSYEKLIATHALIARQKARMSVLEGDVSVILDIYTTHKTDLDNVGKLILDSLNGILWVDDEQVTVLVIRKHREGPERIELEVNSA
jgi:Holliday junction resolvase RusA-like endonuclease